ncbi:SHOCT domain-containing protein [Rhodococcus sp. ARC_M6]|uniref:SHOCT domain-containing protein n=1 Tax=Rhodococcus sp. ARC_M6 TaxID=2928852 RepID=UPI001FB45C7C|nr:SHOCT domain-containing protein [Rhodococcus sp. ARC_M6]MCJ0906832.1 SHOCT domain-containing protein [Rhodococcus sp. ARC_M6]
MSFIRRASRVAVASSIHGNVQRRQRTRWAEADQRAAETQAQQVPVVQPIPDLPPLPVAAEISMDAKIEQLTKLGELKAAGVLTDAEFDAQKARILG